MKSKSCPSPRHAVTIVTPSRPPARHPSRVTRHAFSPFTPFTPFTLFTLFTLFTPLLSGCVTAPDDQTNFRDCLADESTCNSALLTEEQTRQLIEVRRPLHFVDCLAGRRCNESLLDESERRQVLRAASQRNFEACLRGEAACRPDRLREDQKAQADQAGDARNYCMSGLSACDPGTLDHGQAQAARDAYLQRNFAGCMNSVGTLLRCRTEDLSPEQAELVQRRNLAVNFYICSNALIGCNDGLLTPEQRVALREGKRANP